MTTIIEILLCWLVTDFISGLLHWFEDTWLRIGPGWVYRQITLPNLVHHTFPAKLASATYWQNNQMGIKLASLIAAGGVLLHADWHFYLITIMSSHSNQIHTWAHSQKRPAVIKLLQRLGLLQSPAHHAKHHKQYDRNFCVVSDLLNPWLEYFNFWVTLEYLGMKAGFNVYRGTSARNYL